MSIIILIKFYYIASLSFQVGLNVIRMIIKNTGFNLQLIAEGSLL